jgi:hypothetical protein
MNASGARPMRKPFPATQVPHHNAGRRSARGARTSLLQQRERRSIRKNTHLSEGCYGTACGGDGCGDITDQPSG